VEKLELISRSRSIRKNILSLCFDKKASHVGGALSITDILNYLYSSYLKIDPRDFKNSNRDRLFYSKGHACTALYCTLLEFGFFKKEDLSTFTDNGSYFTSHVNHKINGVEISTGSLGHALSVSVGVAYSLKLNKKTNKIVTILSDGELNEGSNWEALMFAAHHQLDNLTIVVDYNKIQSFGRVEDVIKLEPLKQKFEAFNLNTISIDGHDFVEIHNAFSSDHKNRPKLIIANTIKGKGVSFMEDRLEWHYKSPNQSELDKAFLELEG
jgi:transketolase